jgi:hypothetical protein
MAVALLVHGCKENHPAAEEDSIAAGPVHNAVEWEVVHTPSALLDKAAAQDMRVPVAGKMSALGMVGHHMVLGLDFGFDSYILVSA